MAVKVGDEKLLFDPKFLFQRLVALSVDDIEKKEMFSYKLCSFPTTNGWGNW